MRYRGGRRSAVPVLLAPRERDHVARPDLLDRPARALHAPAARRHHQRLAKRVSTPSGAGARLKLAPILGEQSRRPQTFVPISCGCPFGVSCKVELW